MPSKNEIRTQQPLWLCILVVLALYILQGVMLGVVDAVPLYLTSFHATWTQQSIISFIKYPFALKLLWAPLIDVFYIRWLGRRRTWLLPVQAMLGVTCIILSFNLESLLVQLRVTELTVIFFFMIFLTATQDICVDGWALTLFSSSDIIWQSISQTTGQPLGSFFGSSFLLTFESANMTNRLIRQPLGIADQPYGLFTLAQFLRFWGIIFLVAGCVITFFFREQQQNTNTNKKENDEDHLSLFETYLYIVRLFKKKCFCQLLVILIVPHIGFAATVAMTKIMLISRGMITRETLGLITMPLILIKVTVPLFLSRVHRPLTFYAHTYVPRLILCVLIALFVFFGLHLQSYPAIFYGLLITLLGLSDALIYLQSAARCGFFASISDKRIGSTYYTVLLSLTNAGNYASSTAVLSITKWLPEEQAYYIEVGVCILLGCVWLCTSWRLMHRLQAIPVERWHLSLHKRQLNGDHPYHHQLITVSNRKTELTSGTANMELSPLL